MPDEGIAARLKLVRESLGLSQKGLSKKLGVGAGTWQNLEAGGNVPSGETLLRIVELGFSPTWVLTGHGPPRLPDHIESDGTATTASKRPASTIDGELLGRIVDAVGRLYGDLGMSIPRVDLGKLSAEKYDEIVAASDDPAEYPTMLKLAIAQLRKELLTERQSEHRKGQA